MQVLKEIIYNDILLPGRDKRKTLVEQNSSNCKNNQ